MIGVHICILIFTVLYYCWFRSWLTLEMENQRRSDETAETFTWTIKNFSKLRNKLFSEIFFIGGHPWRVFIFPKGNNVDYLSIYLDAGDSANLPYGWSRFAKFKLSLINKVNSKMTKTKETEHEFNARENDWGFTAFMPLNEIRDPSKGFIVDDTCIIEAEIFVTKREHENQVDQAAKNATVTPVSTQVNAVPDNPSPKETSSTSLGELVDFRGLGKIERAFVPLLEEVCSRHPSLIKCQQNRSCRFTEWAFTALGRVLHFLKTKKVRDMNDALFMHLQALWEELETFKFDLTWLEPHVQSALGIKSYMERAAEVKKMKENVAVREMEIKRLKAKMAAAEIDLEIAKRDLVKAEEGFEERDLDGDLGYKA
ncbi:PREDICTED: MATH domain and coiled-coil domain-containing protein At3g58270-like isoform X1 [Lupinus angustifolius]|uniref:MATH domain and coiled-coil domain-containing protein At3g58270-like isoform X1 n=2 Tax=Lupinus angustifolius TaxID=3871 RepID=UPI00092E2FFD|nr:PREDICTED: MATH domain and coiled-coil domain-containing protein At3g58270-like isoform X1 [Lupinus angustifolius]